MKNNFPRKNLAAPACLPYSGLTVTIASGCHPFHNLRLYGELRRFSPFARISSKRNITYHAWSNPTMQALRFTRT
jgi:hypothetical protein